MSCGLVLEYKFVIKSVRSDQSWRLTGVERVGKSVRTKGSSIFIKKQSPVNQLDVLTVIQDSIKQES